MESQINPLSHTPLSINSLHYTCIYLHSSAVYYYKHCHLIYTCIYKFHVILDIRLNTLAYKFFTISVTHNFACGLLIFLQLPLHLFILILKVKKNTGSSLLTLTICDLTLHSWLFIEMQLSGIAFSEAALNEFMLVKSIKTQIL